MIALDSSALLRFLVDDDRVLAGRVEAALGGDEPVGISTPVLLEVVHVLRGSRYGRDNPTVADAVIGFLGHENVVLTDLDADLAAAAIAAVRHLSPRHIADALISAAARQAGARQLLTADRTFASQLVPIVQLGD
jgi:Predicted nucleic-acid-binding protein, contains PIN domain